MTKSTVNKSLIYSFPLIFIAMYLKINQHCQFVKPKINNNRTTKKKDTYLLLIIIINKTLYIFQRVYFSTRNHLSSLCFNRPLWSLYKQESHD